MNDRLVTDDMPPELVTPEMRDTCLEARDKLVELDAANMVLFCDLEEARSRILYLELALSAVLPIAERSAIGVDIRTCQLIRTALGKPPRKGKPTLTVVENGEAS